MARILREFAFYVIQKAGLGHTKNQNEAKFTITIAVTNVEFCLGISIIPLLHF
ncbi:hypothetical protein FORC36_3083 [Vibrio vulnificus]|nr:hypothetical protein FORC36_3083 [Vibrio vulnificus]